MHGSDSVYDFGQRLAELRKKRRLSQSDVANKLGVNKATVSAYERNTTAPSIETLKRLAVIYNASVDFILGFADRSHLFIDDLSPNQQEFMLDMLKQVRDRFTDREVGEEK